MWKLILLLDLLLVSSVFSERSPRHIIQSKRTRENSLRVVEYPLCGVGDISAACLSPQECRVQGGSFAGLCKDSGLECCFVQKTCGGETSSHSVTFRNPSYPSYDNQTGGVLCPLTIRLGRGVCAVRVDLTVFELAKYEDGVCIRDTLTILGSTEGVATPVCGNMTGYETTFPVNEFGTVTLALVAQSKHKFSITVNQLDCKEVPTFISPTYAGVRNHDAEKYTPPSTPAPKKKPDAASLKDDNSTSSEMTTTEDPGESMTTTLTPNSSREKSGDSEEVIETTEADTTTETITTTESSSDNSDEKDDKQTTLKIGVFPSKKTTTPYPPIIIKSNTDIEEDDGIYEDALDVTPAVSWYKKAFELRVNDKCWQYEEEEPVTNDGFRIIGGFRTNINEYPWQVALIYKKKFFCGGSLISDRHILTAAHCVFGSFSKGIHHLRVSLGDHDLTTKNDTDNVVRRVKKVIWHMNYSPHININDIAIFELEKPVNFTYNVGAVKLPLDSDDMFHDQNATVTGWGRYTIKSRKKTSPILKEYTGPLFNNTVCAKKWKKFPSVKATEDRHICLDVKMGTPCHGDSGGPLVVCTGDQCSQVGVVSFGFPLCTNVGLPAVFTRTTYYRPWLDRNLAKLRIRPVI